MSIEKKIIMSPKNPRPLVLKYCLFLFVGIFLLSLKSCSDMGVSNVVTMSVLLFIVIGVLLVMPIWALASKRVQTLALAEAKQKFSEFIGKPTKYMDVSFSIGQDGTSGTAIAYDDRQIFIMDHGTAAKINWEDVRNWEWEIAGYNTVSPKRLADGVNVASKNMTNRSVAYVGSGFFINVADIDKPRWQFMSDDKKTLTKWMEIFQQVKEGALT